MRDQGGASGAGARIRTNADAAHDRLSPAAAPNAAPATELLASATVIAPAPALWGERVRWLEPPIGGAVKRAIDIIIAATALIVLSPLLVAIWIAVRLERGGDAIFRQERGGFAGTTFKIFKFRTMVCAEDGAQVRQVEAGDSRITPLGRLLRASSFDELPQLVNVLRGDMSLIGPRPHAVEHDKNFSAIDTSYSLRFRARPGITGLAQVSGCRGPTETPDKVQARTAFDVQYVMQWSLWADVRILVRTLGMFVKRDPSAI